MLFRYAMKSAVFREIVQTKFSSVSTIAVVKKKVVPRRISGNCARHQRKVTLAIKRARTIALLPFTVTS